MIGSIRRECLDHVVVMGERHLLGILSKYVDYYNGTRTHLSLAKDAPEPRSVQPPSQGSVVEVPRVGGLHHGAAARNATISKCAADCLREYFALRAELTTAIEMPGEPGAPHQGVVIHSLLARSEERLVATFDRRSTEILRELRRVTSMLDRLVQLYLAHTPEVPHELRAGAIASANRRYASYQRAVTEALAQLDPSTAGSDSVKG